MNILIVTGHPAQVHNFKHVKWELEKKGNKVFWLATNKDISKYLLNYYGIEYTVMSKPGKSILSKIKALINNTFFAVKYLKKNKIDIILSRISPQLSLAGILTGTKHFGLTDTETAGIYDKIFSKFLSNVFTAKSFTRQLRKDQIRFDGNIELFYLHPKRFKPLSKKDVAILLGIDESQPYIIMRFVSWDAYHDKGLFGFTDENKLKAVKEFSQHAKVFISAEKELPESLEPYKISIPPERMHDVLAHAKMFFGESGTMASESAVLGRPTIYLNESWLGYLLDAQEFGLLFAYKQRQEDQIKAIQKGIELLQDTDLETQLNKNHLKFMQNKIDVTGFMVWFVENYPDSFRIMKENPDYQRSFLR